MNLAALFTVLLQLGYSGQNDPIIGGGLIFLVAAVSVGYLAFFREEMNAGPVLKIGSIMLFALTLLAFLWPQRPWPH